MKLEIEQLSKIYPNRKQALQNITLTLEAGVYALFGWGCYKLVSRQSA